MCTRTHAHAHTHTRALFARAEQHDLARLDYGEALRLQPQEADAWYFRGALYEKEGLLDEVGVLCVLCVWWVCCVWVCCVVSGGLLLPPSSSLDGAPHFKVGAE